MARSSNEENPPTEISSNSERTLSIKSPGSTTITASEISKGNIVRTIHSAEDIDTDGILMLQEAIDTKPNQILVFPWNRDETLVRFI